MFEAMIHSIKEDFVKFCYNATIKTSTEKGTLSEAARSIRMNSLRKTL